MSLSWENHHIRNLSAMEKATMSDADCRTMISLLQMCQKKWMTCVCLPLHITHFQNKVRFAYMWFIETKLYPESKLLRNSGKCRSQIPFSAAKKGSKWILSNPTHGLYHKMEGIKLIFSQAICCATQKTKEKQLKKSSKMSIIIPKLINEIY